MGDAADGQPGVDEGHPREPDQAVGTWGERDGHHEPLHQGPGHQDHHDRNADGAAVVDIRHHQALHGLRHLVMAMTRTYACACASYAASACLSPLFSLSIYLI